MEGEESSQVLELQSQLNEGTEEDSADEAKKKNKELMTVCKELQKLLKEANEGRLHLARRLQEKSKEFEEKIRKLERELENAKTGAAPLTPVQPSNLLPTAALTSCYMKPGMSLTQIKSRRVKFLDALRPKKDENMRLRNCLDQMLKGIKEKAPVLQQQRRDYEQFLHGVDQLSRRLIDATLVENKKLKAHADEATKENEHLKRENDRLRNLPANLSQQLSAASKEFEKEGMAGEGGDEDNKSVEELWEIIKFVRHEKEISETKCEQFQYESIRYKQRCEYLEGQIEDLQKNITEQRTRSEVDFQTAVQHAEIMKRVENLNELKVANKVLENEKTNAEKKARELVVKVQQLEGEMRLLKADIQSMTTKNDALLAEKTALKYEVEKITHHFVTCVEKQTKEMEELKKKVNESGQPAGEGAAAGTSAPPAENVDVTIYENEIKVLTEKLQISEEEVKKLKELDEQNKALLKEKEDKNKKVLIQAQEKQRQLTATKDRLNAENEDLKKKQKSVSDEKESLCQQLSELEMRLKVLNSQSESKIARLEKELQDAKEEKDKLEKAVGDAKNQLDNNLQKQKIEEPEVSSEVTASEQPQPTPLTAVVSGKRQRDEPEVTDRSTTDDGEGTGAEDEPMTKRIRTAEVQFVGEVGTSQEAVIEDTTAEEPTDNELGEGEGGVEASDFLEVYEGEDIGGEAAGTGKLVTVTLEVVLIDSYDDDEDEEEQEEGKEGEEGEYQEDDDDGGEYDDEEEEDEMEEGDDDEYEAEEYMGEEGDEGEDEDIEEDEDDKEAKHEVVEVIDDDDVDEDVGEGQAMEDTPLEEEVWEDIEEEEDTTERMEEGQDEVEQTETSETAVEREISSTAQHNVPETERQLMEAEHRVTPPATAPFAQRLLSARSHLPPFSFPQGQPAPGPFNDEEDCMVPSTPTLFVPKRTDGFAEAISSPQINRSSFSFGAPGETSMSSAGGLELGMSEEGLRVDDTQVDLMGGSDEASNERPSFVVPTGLPETSESNTQPNQRLPSTGSDTRQLSLESLESEPDVGSIATVPVIRVTEASEESNEQNVPVSKAHPESLETEVVELLEEAEKLGEETGSQEAEVKDSEEGTSESASAVKEDISQPVTSGESSSASSQSSTAGSDPTTAGTGAAAKAKQDPNRPKGTVVQLRRPGTSATWSQTRGGHQVQRGAPASGRVRRLRRDPVRGPSHRGRGTPISRGRASGTPRGGEGQT